MRNCFRFISLIWVFTAVTASSQVIDLDPGFGTGGIVTTEVSAAFDYLYDLEALPDGRIIAAGYGNDDDGDTSIYMIVARYHENGTPDNSFGTNGVVKTFAGGVNSWAYELAVQSDGKYIVAGNNLNAAGISAENWVIARYLENGDLDTSFSQDGMSIQAVTNFSDFIFALDIQTDGRIIAGGRVPKSPNNQDFGLVRMDTNGTIDNTFGNYGKVITNMANKSNLLEEIRIQPDGKILAAGTTVIGSQRYLSIVRYMPDGSLDSTFNYDGIAFLTAGFGITGNRVAYDDQGRILALGDYFTFGYVADSSYVMRLMPDGTPDSTFSDDGIAEFTMDSAAFGKDFEVFDDKSILIGGNYGSHAVLLKITKDGIPEISFGNNGVAAFPLPYFNTNITCLELQDDGKMLLGGAVTEFSGSFPDFLMMRFTPDIPTQSPEIVTSDAWIVYPNPAQNSIYLQGDGITEVNELIILNMLGQVVEVIFPEVSTNGFVEVDIRYLQPGLYTIQVPSAAEIPVARFVKH